MDGKFVKLNVETENNLRVVKSMLLLKTKKVKVTDGSAINEALKKYIEAGNNVRRSKTNRK